jgi:hypothetical protein
MVKKSGVGTIRGWMKHGIESKQEVVILRSSYKPSFEGSFSLFVCLVRANGSRIGPVDGT